MAPVGQARRQALAALAAVELARLVPDGVVGRRGVVSAGGQHEVAAEAGDVGDVVAAVAGQAGAGGERLERRFDAYGAVPEGRERRVRPPRRGRPASSVKYCRRSAAAPARCAPSAADGRVCVAIERPRALVQRRPRSPRDVASAGVIVRTRARRPAREAAATASSKAGQPLVEHPVGDAEARTCRCEARGATTRRSSTRPSSSARALGGPVATARLALTGRAPHGLARVRGCARSRAPGNVGAARSSLGAALARRPLQVETATGAADAVAVAVVRDVGSRVADLVGQKAGLESVEHLARRAGVEPDRGRVAGRSQAAK